MDKRTLTLTLGVLLLFLPILPLAAAFHYAGKVPMPPTQGDVIEREETYRSPDELRYEFSIPESRYLAITVSMGGCCPPFEAGDALAATVTSPNGATYLIRAEAGECHSADGCWRRDNPYLQGEDLIILVDPPIGKYEVVIRPSGELEEIPSTLTQVGANAIIWQERENDSTLLSNDVWWYYPDGSSEHVKEAGFFGVDDAKPRILALSVVAVLGWVGAVLLLVRARRLRLQEKR